MGQAGHLVAATYQQVLRDSGEAEVLICSGTVRSGYVYQQEEQIHIGELYRHLEDHH